MPVLVIGAGPAGLAIAACLQRREVPFDLVDRRGAVGGAWRHIYVGTTLTSPARYTSLPGLRLRHPTEYITAPDYHAYLQAYAAHHDLKARRAEVTQLSAQRRSFTVKFREELQPRAYEAVVVATGMFDFPSWPKIPGLTNEQASDLVALHAKDWRGPAPIQGKRLLIIGGASGAIEIAEECARAGQPVVMSTRTGIKISPQRFLGRDAHDFAYLVADTLPRALLGTFCDRRPTLPGIDLGFARFRKAGLIDVRGPIDHFEGRSTHFADGQVADFDVVVTATGYQFATPFLPANLAHAPAGHPQADEGESRTYPRLYFVGVPCCRSLVSEFLRGIARDAPAIAQKISL